MERNFIQETIDSLRKSATKIEDDFIDFRNGRITKEQFEKNYRQVLGGWLSELDDEEYAPNNGCKYSDTVPDNEYFKKNLY